MSWGGVGGGVGDVIDDGGGVSRESEGGGGRGGYEKKNGSTWEGAWRTC